MWEGVTGLAGSAWDGAKNFVSHPIDFLGANKDAITTAGAAANIGLGFYNAGNQADYYENQKKLGMEQLALAKQQAATTEAERQRQIQKEGMAQAAMNTGYDASGLAAYSTDKTKKKNTDVGRNITNPYYYDNTAVV